MITILNNIMASNGFSLVDVDLADDAIHFSLYKAQNRRREEYFLTLEISNPSNEELQLLLDEKAQGIFEDIQKTDKVERFFEKNCTMFICLNSTKLDQNLVLALEEDPYNFKKNVITYSTVELVALNGYLTSNSIHAISNGVINDILNSNSGKDFLDFKLQTRTRNHLYDLIIRATLKLPFLVYSPQEQKLENLSLQINNAIPTQLAETYNNVLSAEWTDENILANVESIWGDKA
ncbi:TPA: ABC-three component system middle component 1 [Pseudomonas aeruginosa]|jgi:hypothetical protein|uniref:ABC-three component system middle component 1 n=2 Tax=Pseudomonas aeruginosa TaxID=287 RepID=UPI00053DE42B|nr:ABC-three component system middle component 1 [Pseudomonas aeruginosa]MBG5794187.1 hypothetical protein [Pseudomonas aeruginosa]MCO2604245.1 hypothetical protein [Pseudomonas aeruginosa]RQA71446.1 hypothetical protein IPC472_31995 [Pseudomonas aeruginosa]RTU81936.1 hypothetical protein DY980_33525 [Pseudomonas aeruginosa]HBP1730966.1 hypothetical protein [Pseudomonas aeruginosa]